MSGLARSLSQASRLVSVTVTRGGGLKVEGATHVVFRAQVLPYCWFRGVCFALARSSTFVAGRNLLQSLVAVDG
ncbi:hypothetical protein KC345_g67 [Hortaea werneckii]|nr:hypothetical protein KC345_g67 [Hortaea werneckii]